MINEKFLHFIWKSHYVFDKKSNYQNKRIGKSTIDLLFINAILPFCFFMPTCRRKGARGGFD